MVRWRNEWYQNEIKRENNNSNKEREKKKCEEIFDGERIEFTFGSLMPLAQHCVPADIFQIKNENQIKDSGWNERMETVRTKSNTIQFERRN